MKCVLSIPGKLLIEVTNLPKKFLNRKVSFDGVKR
jgi:hypothetical protein